MSVHAGKADILSVPSERIIDAVLEAETALRKADVTDVPRLEAEVLLADLLEVERARIIASYHQPFDQSFGKRNEYISRIERRTKGEPIAYITGEKEFMGLKFRVDRRALVPRPETETLVEWVVKAVGRENSATIIDIGTGCGCIAVSLALLLPHASIHATDISEAALALARENAGLHGARRRISFHAGSVYSALPGSLGGRVNVIVSNPPYISDAEFSDLDRGIRDFEPSLALKGGADGLDVIRELASGAAEYLAPGGMLAVEIGETQAESAREILKNAIIFSEIGFERDMSDRIRVITGRKTR